MYQLAKFGDHRSKGNGDSYIGSYINTLEKAKLIASVQHIERFSKSGIPIYNFKVLETADRKTRTRRRRRRQVITQRFTFLANIVMFLYEGNLSISESRGLMYQ